MSTERVKRGHSRIVVLAVVLAAAYFGAALALKVTAPPAWARLALVSVPFVLSGTFLVAEIRYIRRMDELERRIQLEALAVAYPAAALLIFALGLLERAGLPVPGFERLRDVWPLVILPYVVGIAMATRRYR
jgi:hypothetical protein